MAEISLTGFLGGSSGLLDGADGGGGHGRRDAFKLLRYLLQVSFWKLVHSQGSSYWWLRIT